MKEIPKGGWTIEQMKDEELLALAQQEREKDELIGQLEILISDIEYYYRCGEEGKRKIYKEIENSKNLLNRIKK